MYIRTPKYEAEREPGRDPPLLSLLVTCSESVFFPGPASETPRMDCVEVPKELWLKPAREKEVPATSASRRELRLQFLWMLNVDPDELGRCSPVLISPR